MFHIIRQTGPACSSRYRTWKGKSRAEIASISTSTTASTVSATSATRTSSYRHRAWLYQRWLHNMYRYIYIYIYVRTCSLFLSVAVHVFVVQLLLHCSSGQIFVQAKRWSASVQLSQSQSPQQWIAFGSVDILQQPYDKSVSNTPISESHRPPVYVHVCVHGVYPFFLLYLSISFHIVSTGWQYEVLSLVCVWQL